MMQHQIIRVGVAYQKKNFFFFLAVKVPLDAYMMDFVFSEREDGGIFDNKYGMDYHIPVFGGIVKEPPMNIVHISVEMAPIAKVNLGIDLMVFLCLLFFFLFPSLLFLVLQLPI